MKPVGARPLALLATLLLCFFVAGTARAQVPLLDGYGGPMDFGVDCLYPNDDGSSAEIDLTPAFPRGLAFFDRTHTSTYVNTNGNITFSEALWTYTPDPFPVADQPMIAPYWADVDIRGPACEWGSGDEGCLNPTENGVWWHLEPGLMVVTWHETGYFLCHDDLKMSFQLVLTAAGTEGECTGAGDFDVEFRYNRCEWTTGDASGGTGGFGGTPGQAGFDAGNLTDYVEIPGSRTDDIHNILCTDSNVGEPGIWRFQIRGGSVVCPGGGEPCDTGLLGVCASGITQCVAADILCLPEIDASDERCDALDNDCDGDVDDGDDLCPAYQVCDRGFCVHHCSEFGCAEGRVCGPEGFCIDEACIGVTCDPGERCVGGSCVGACEGIVCPLDQSCRSGRCVNLCETLTCDDCTVCVDGECVIRCQYRECPAGQVCLEDGRCVDSGCESLDCPRGEVCRGGACVDACRGAVCPEGETCREGSCISDDAPPPGSDGDADIDADADVDADADPPGGGSRCSCSAPGSERTTGAALLLVLALPAVLVARRVLSGRRRR